VHVISKRGLRNLAATHPETKALLEEIYRVARKSRWHGLHEVRETYPSAIQVGSVLIFNVLGGNYRLIMTVNYSRQLMHVKALLTHREYDRKEWMKWA
jgi:mRNA interferase HigB